VAKHLLDDGQRCAALRHPVPERAPHIVRPQVCRLSPLQQPRPLRPEHLDVLARNLARGEHPLAVRLFAPTREDGDRWAYQRNRLRPVALSWRDAPHGFGNIDLLPSAWRAGSRRAPRSEAPERCNP
jgi:hypothetical protein